MSSEDDENEPALIRLEPVLDIYIGSAAYALPDAAKMIMAAKTSATLFFIKTLYRTDRTAKIHKERWQPKGSLSVAFATNKHCALVLAPICYKNSVDLINCHQFITTLICAA
jgi:hypothetical protein